MMNDIGVFHLNWGNRLEDLKNGQITQSHPLGRFCSTHMQQ
jgi:hypothetical protein